MDAMLDTLAASRKLEESGIPEPQAGAVVEVMNDAVKNLVTKEYLEAELESRFSKFERKIDRKFEEHFGEVDGRFEKTNANINELRLSIAELGKSQAWGFVYVCGITIAVAALLFSALQFFGTGAAAAPVNFPEPGPFRLGPPELPAIPPEVTLEPDPAADL